MFDIGVCKPGRVILIRLRSELAEAFEDRGASLDEALQRLTAAVADFRPVGQQVCYSCQGRCKMLRGSEGWRHALDERMAPGATMPIRVTIDHFNRVVIGVGDGVLTIPDLVAFSLEVLQAKVVHYGKIIDVAGSEPAFTRTELLAFAQVVRETRAGEPRGPLALVVDPTRGELAKLFAGLEMDGRPGQVFRSIHDARRWLTARMRDHERPDDES